MRSLRDSIVLGLLVLAKLTLSRSTDDNILSNAISHEPIFDKDFYLKAHSYIIQARVFKNFTIEDTIYFVDYIDSWKPPKEIVDGFPYYLSGFDYDDRPIWAAEVGKYNIRDLVEKGQDAIDDIERYSFQAAVRVLKSMNTASAQSGRDVTQYVLLTDWEGLDMRQIAHAPTISLGISVLHRYLDMLVAGLGQIIGINVNYPTKLLIDIFRPYIGGFFEKIETYGPNKARWMSALRRTFPPESIPAWYGGSKAWKPLQVYG